MTSRFQRLLRLGEFVFPVILGAVLAKSANASAFPIGITAVLSLFIVLCFRFVSRKDSFVLHAFPTSDKESQDLQRQGMALYEREWNRQMTVRGGNSEIMMVLVLNGEERRVVGIASVADVSTSLDNMRRMLAIGIPKEAVIQRMKLTMGFVETAEDADRLLSDDVPQVGGDREECRKLDDGRHHRLSGDTNALKPTTEAYFGNLVIDPDFRGRGLGKAMTRAAVLCAHDILGVDRLHGTPATKPLVGFYQRLGASIQKDVSHKRKGLKVKISSKQLVAPRLVDMDMHAIRRDLVKRGRIELRF